MEPELWNRGMTQSIFYIPDGGMATFSGEGLWADLEACNLPAGHAVSPAVAPTSRDPRHRRYVFAICIHQVLTKERVGSLTGICPGKATRLRALFYGLKHLSLHIRDKVHVAVLRSMLRSSSMPSGRTGTSWRRMRSSLTLVSVWSMRIEIKFVSFSSTGTRWIPTSTGKPFSKMLKPRPLRPPFWLGLKTS